MFCRRQYCFDAADVFVAANICRRQYFVDANILSVFRFKDDYLLLMIVFCVYDAYY